MEWDVKPLPNPGYLNECFIYVDGALIWRWRPREHFKSDRSFKQLNTLCAGKVAGRPMVNRGYWQTMLDGERFLNHRIIACMFGLRMDGVIDHIDRDPTNNRIENLRACSQAENTRNNSGWGSRSGLKGVYQRSNGKWTAAIREDGKLKNLGTHERLEDAVNARRAAERKTYAAFGAEHGVTFREPETV
jgi:hypothetical protein